MVSNLCTWYNGTFNVVNSPQLTTPCLNKKTSKIVFVIYHAKIPPNLIIFGTKMANSPKLYELHSFSTSPNSRQCTTVLNAHVKNWYITL